MKRNTSAAKEIHMVLNNSSVSQEAYFSFLSKSDSDMLYKQLSPIYKSLSKVAPDKLYRLRSFSDNSVDALKNDRLFLTRADYFNDPFECLLCFDTEKLNKSINYQISEQNMKASLAHRNIQYPVNERIKSERDFLDFAMEFKNDFLNQVSNTFPKIVEKLQRGTYITCFSERIDSPIMWSHYADYHKGFAIEYQYEPEDFYPRPHVPGDDRFEGYGWLSLLPVYYSKYRRDGIELAEWYALCQIREDIGIKSDEAILLPDMLLKTKLSLEKSEKWAYEKEWRMILTHEWPNEFGNPKIHLAKKATAIYLGAKMSDTNRQVLINIAKDKGIPVYEMYIDHENKEYIMNYREI